MTTYQIDNDELAMALTQIGQTRMALALLEAAPPQFTTDEAQDRLRGGAQSLAIEELAAIDPDGVVSLDAAFEQAIRGVAGADFTVRLQIDRHGATETTGFHVSADAGVVEHRMVGDEHHIKVLRNVQAALVACVRSAFVPAIDEDCQQFQMHPDAIRQIEAATSAVEIRGVLANAGVPEAAIEAFASDLADATARGSVLRVTYPPDQTPVSDVGFLLLRARARLWTIKVDAASPNVTMVRTVDEASFAEQVRSLFDATE